MGNTKKENRIFQHEMDLNDECPVFYTMLAKKKTVTLHQVGTFEIIFSKPIVQYNVQTKQKKKGFRRLRVLFRPSLSLRNYLKKNVKMDTKGKKTVRA